MKINPSSSNKKTLLELGLFLNFCVQNFIDKKVCFIYNMYWKKFAFFIKQFKIRIANKNIQKNIQKENKINKGRETKVK